MWQTNATQPMRKMMMFCAAAATCGVLLLTPSIEAQTSAGGTTTAAAVDNTDAPAQAGTMTSQQTTGSTPGAMGMGNMRQPATVQPATGPMTGMERGNTFYSSGRHFPWGLLGLIGLLGLWPRSRVTVDRTHV